MRLERSISGWAKPVHVHKSRSRLTNVPGHPRRSTGLWRASREDYHENCKPEKRGPEEREMRRRPDRPIGASDIEAPVQITTSGVET